MIRQLLITITFSLTITVSYAQWNYLGGSHIGWGSDNFERATLETDSSDNPIIIDASNLWEKPKLRKFTGNSWLNLPMDSLYISPYPWTLDLSINSANDMICGFIGSQVTPVFNPYSSLYMYKFNGSYWYPLGSNYGQIDSINDSTSALLSLSIKVSQNGTPFAAFTYRNKFSDTTKYVIVKKFHNNSWVNVGLPASVQEYGYITLDDLDKPLELFLGNNDTPYVCTEAGSILRFNGQNWNLISNAQKVFMDWQKNLYSASADTGLAPFIILKKYIGGNWITLSNSPSGSSDKIRLLSFVISPAGTPYVAYENLQSKYISIINYSGNNWQPSGTNIVQRPYNAKFLFTSNGKLMIRINTGRDVSDSTYRWVLAYSPGTALPSFCSTETINAYPNPTNDDILHLQLSEYLTSDDNVLITIRDLTGKIIVQDEGTPELLDEINVGQLASGIYIISVSINNLRLKSFKFCKN